MVVVKYKIHVEYVMVFVPILVMLVVTVVAIALIMEE